MITKVLIWVLFCAWLMSMFAGIWMIANIDKAVRRMFKRKRKKR